MDAKISAECAEKMAKTLVGKISLLSSNNVPFCERKIPSPMMRFFPHQCVVRMKMGLGLKRRAALATNK